MIYGSVCSGIEGASVAWEPLGWTPAFFAEIEPQPAAVLAHRFPNVPNLGDFTRIEPGHAVDILVGGTPCQSFSIAGLRGGMADARGNLALEFLRLAQRLGPRWVVWENVPGVLSSVSHAAPDPRPPEPPVDLGCNGAEMESVDEYNGEELHAFSCFLAGLSELGYGLAYRVLDAQFCRVDGYPGAVPQRRERVFVVGYLGDWRRAAAVLFERSCLLGDSPPRRETGKVPAGTISARTSAGGGLGGTDFECAGGLVPERSPPLLAKGNDSFDESLQTYVPEIVGQAMSSKWSKGSSGPAGDEVANLVAFSAVDTAPIAFDSKASGRNGFGVGEISPTLRAMGHAKTHQNAGGQVAVAIQERAVSENPNAGPDGVGVRADGSSYTLEARTVPQAVCFQPRIGRNGRGFEEEIAPALNGTDAGATSDMRPCVAFKPSHYTRGKDGAPSDVFPPLSADADKGDQDAVIAFLPDIEPKAQSDVAFTLKTPSASGGGQPQSVMSGWRVRRLTPLECERLQGFPEIANCVTINAWCSSDLLKSRASAEIQNHKSPNCASPAEGIASNPSAKNADVSLNINHHGDAAPVVLDVQVSLERGAVRISRAGKCLWYAVSVENPNLSHLPIATESFVRLIALLSANVASGVLAGREVLPAHSGYSSLQLRGNASVSVSGREIADLVGDAEKFTTKVAECMRFTTSPRGDNSLSSDDHLQTLYCCVMAAISSFIPSEIRQEGSYAVRFETTEGYTAVPYQGRTMADGPRYRMLGNSFAVNVVRWIGRRIEMVDAI